MGFRGRHANKRDANEADLVAEFRAHGCSVQHMDIPCDLVIGFRGASHLVEVKQEGKKLNDKQREFVGAWNGDFYVVRTVEDVRQCIEEWSSTSRRLPIRGEIT